MSFAKLSKLCDTVFSNFKLKCTSSCCTAEVIIAEQDHQQPPKHEETNQPPLKLKDIFIDPKEEVKEDTEPSVKKE